MRTSVLAVTGLMLIVGGCGAPSSGSAGSPVEGSGPPICDAADPRAGTSAALAGFFHSVAGTVVVRDGCTLAIENFTYDGGGLDTVILASPTGNFVVDGVALTGNLVGRPFNNETLELPLPGGVSLDDARFISVWCVPVATSFGQTELPL